MASEPTTLRTRRAVLLGAVGAAGALAVAAVAKPEPASAQTQYMVLGGNQTQDETGVTTIRNQASDSGAMSLDAAGGGLALSVTYRGSEASGLAIQGFNYHGSGVEGYAHVSGHSGVRGRGVGGTGVLGFSGPLATSTPAAVAKTGVYGSATQDSGSIGVYGKSTTGRGGVFTGKLANLRLPPSSAASHPATGQPGDVFVDASYRLWFCLGGASWKRVQLV